jgi:glycosyltransferase involved in cell wall biosynthesis
MSSYHTSFSQYATLYGLGVLAAPGWTFLRWFHNGTSLTLCPTHAIRDELVGHGFHNVDIWTRGVDAHQFNPRWRSIALRAHWGADDDTTVITYVGRLAAEKGLDVALSAMRSIAAERSNVTFVIGGDGPLAGHCREHAPPGTIFTGRMSAKVLSEAYASSDVFLFPSTTETFGNVALEAMASGLVVVGADVPQTREVVPNDCGVFFRPGDGDAMAIAVRRLLERPDDIAAKRRAAVATANARGWDAIFDRLEADYKRVASFTPLAATRDLVTLR